MEKSRPKGTVRHAEAIIEELYRAGQMEFRYAQAMWQNLDMLAAYFSNGSEDLLPAKGYIGNIRSAMVESGLRDHFSKCLRKALDEIEQAI